jgi:AraC-like DNA-binding protein
MEQRDSHEHGIEAISRESHSGGAGGAGDVGRAAAANGAGGLREADLLNMFNRELRASLRKEESIAYDAQERIVVLINHTDETGFMLDMQWHDYYEVLYIFEGEAVQFIDGQICRMRAKDIAIIAPGCVHTTYAAADHCSILVLLFFPRYLDYSSKALPTHTRFLGDFLDNASLKSGYLLRDNEFEQDFNRITSKLNEEYELKQAGYNMVVKGLLYEFLGFLQRAGMLLMPAAIEESSLMKIARCCNYIEENYSRQITMGEVAGVMGYSSGHFSRLFKLITGRTYKNYLDYVRVAEAKWMLAYGHEPVFRVAEMSGFENPSSFSRAFRRISGITPTQYIARRGTA